MNGNGAKNGNTRTSKCPGTGAALPSLPLNPPALTPAPGGQKYNYCFWSYTWYK